MGQKKIHSCQWTDPPCVDRERGPKCTGAEIFEYNMLLGQLIYYVHKSTDNFHHLIIQQSTNYKSESSFTSTDFSTCKSYILKIVTVSSNLTLNQTKRTFPTLHDQRTLSAKASTIPFPLISSLLMLYWATAPEFSALPAPCPLCRVLKTSYQTYFPAIPDQLPW